MDLLSRKVKCCGLEIIVLGPEPEAGVDEEEVSVGTTLLASVFSIILLLLS